MKCERARNLIHAELDGEINAEQQGSLQAHVETCESCRALRAQFKAMVEGFEWLAEESETVPQTAPAIIRLSWTRRVAGAAVAAAAAIALLVAWPFGGAPGDVAMVLDQPVQPKIEFQLLGESFEQYLAVEQESSDPHVHIVWLYKNQGYSKKSSSMNHPEKPVYS